MFFIVLDLRLTWRGYRGIPFFMPCRSEAVLSGWEEHSWAHQYSSPLSPAPQNGEIAQDSHFCDPWKGRFLTPCNYLIINAPKRPKLHLRRVELHLRYFSSGALWVSAHSEAFFEVWGMPLPIKGKSVRVSDGEIISAEQGNDDFNKWKACIVLREG